MLNKILNFCNAKYPKLSQKIAYNILFKDQRNVNLDLTNPNQKRVLICYMTLTGKDLINVSHANQFHLIQIIHYFSNRDFCVDLCIHNDISAYERLKHNDYDVILGFGPVYKKFCSTHQIPIRICFLTENNPEVVQEKYEERLYYFHRRHPKSSLKHNISRTGYYNTEDFKRSTSMILMNSEYNAQSLYKHISSIYRINCNAIFNPNFIFDKARISQFIESSRSNILWFGSQGLIHKGLDILIDTVAKMPNMNLRCYGIDGREYSLFKEIKAYNTIDCGRVNVLSENFITEVVLKHNIVVLPSCSEGMSTAVATCMAHGIIPIVTTDCGFDKCPYIIQLEKCTVETLMEAIMKVQEMTNDELMELRYNCYKYARDKFSIKAFDDRFTKIMDKILE